MTATVVRAMTGSIRLFVSARLDAGHAVPATQAQAHYLGRVMRRGSGDAVLLFNGRDGEWRASIDMPARGDMRLVVGEQLREQCASSDLWLLMPPLRRERTEWAVEKACELGVARITLLRTVRTTPGRANMARLRAIATEAAEQSERLDVPDIDAGGALVDVLDSWPSGRRLFCAIERLSCPFATPVAGPAALLIGPEGGFAPGELDAIRDSPFVIPVSLGPRILRAETAAIAGLVLLQARATA